MTGIRVHFAFLSFYPGITPPVSYCPCCHRHPIIYWHRMSKLGVIPRASLGNVHCSQRGSPSVLKEDRGGRRHVVPSSLFPNLPYNLPPRTKGPIIPIENVSYCCPRPPPPSPAAPRQSCQFPYANLSYIEGPAVLKNDSRHEVFPGENGPPFALPSCSGLLAVAPPGPTGGPDRLEHWECNKCLLETLYPRMTSYRISDCALCPR